jgi:hypothetical protein
MAREAGRESRAGFFLRDTIKNPKEAGADGQPDVVRNVVRKVGVRDFTKESFDIRGATT